jgi:AcrR family transcriptional regulator
MTSTSASDDPSAPERVTEPPRASVSKAEQKARTRARLMHAALTLFATKGYDSTTVSEVADLADVTERTFFLHFRKKSDAILNLPSENVTRLHEIILAFSCPGADMQILEKAIITWFLQNVDTETEHELAQLRIRAAEKSLTIYGAQLRANSILVDAAASALAERSGVHTPTQEMKVAAVVALRLQHAIVHEWALAAESHDYERIARRTFGSLRRVMSP